MLQKLVFYIYYMCTITECYIEMNTNICDEL